MCVPAASSSRSEALEPADGVGQEWGIRPVDDGDALPHRDRGNAAREVLREVHLIGRQDRYRARARLPEELVGGRLPRDRDPDERRVERERDERRDREPDPLRAGGDRDHRDAGGHPLEDVPELCRRGHGAPMLRSTETRGDDMCRNIKTLHNFEPPATDDEVYAAALQYVRKVSGSTKPSKANEALFLRAVDEIAHITSHLLEDLVTTAPPRDREVEAARARARAEKRFGAAA